MRYTDYTIWEKHFQMITQHHNRVFWCKIRIRDQIQFLCVISTAIRKINDSQNRWFDIVLLVWLCAQKWSGSSYKKNIYNIKILQFVTIKLLIRHFVHLNFAIDVQAKNGINSLYEDIIGIHSEIN